MRFVPVAELAPAQARRTREIYEDGFPPELRQDFDQLPTADAVLAYVKEDDSVAGFVVLRTMTVPGWLFLRYFVAGERGRGTGSQMWRDLFALHPGLDRLDRIVLDVEDPDEPGIHADELTERLRRVAFYERLGARVLPVRAYTPPHDGAEPALRLLVGDRFPGPALSPDGLRDLVLATYRDRYLLPADHPAVRRTLEVSGLAWRRSHPSGA